MKRPSVPWTRLLRNRRAAGGILLLVLLAITAWAIAPRPVDGLMTVDGKHRWIGHAAPPQRQIVWQPAQRIAVNEQDASADQHLIRPHLTDGGGTLFFTLRQSDGTADIFRARWSDGGWRSAEPVAALNSQFDDVAPVISADGSQLYLYSNRPGGQGGFDLYHSRRTGAGWSEPRNLGPDLNTPAHEFDPAIDRDGTTLLFASNRTEEMHRHAQQTAQAERAEQTESPTDVAAQVKESSLPWSTTLRAEQGLTQFDLYLARRNTNRGRWTVAEPVRGVNRDDANEGAPYLSPNGMFVYFASDRPNASGPSRNYDLYRARIDIAEGRSGEAVNLGAGVNSPANETEPALSPEGFRILFSSDRVAGAASERSPPLYSLYSSTAEETQETFDWDTSRWSALTGWLSNNWWFLVLLVLVAAFLVAIVWLIRQWAAGRWSSRRLPVPGFLLVAVALHLLVATGSFFIYFGQAIVNQAKTAFEEVLVASNSHQSHEAGQEAYEKVADLQSLEAAEPTEVVRQVTEAPRVNVPTDSPIPSLPTKVAAENVLPQRAVEATIPENVRADEPQLQRRRIVLGDQAAVEEQVELVRPRAVEAPDEEMSRAEVAITRRRDVTPPPTLDPIARSDPALKPRSEEASSRSVAEATPAAVRPSPKPPLERAREAIEPASATQIATEPTEPVTADNPPQPAPLNVHIDRQMTAASLIPSPELQPSMATDAPPEKFVTDGPSATADVDVPTRIVVDATQSSPLADARRRSELASPSPDSTAVELVDLGEAPQPAPSLIAATSAAAKVERQSHQTALHSPEVSADPATDQLPAMRATPAETADMVTSAVTDAPTVETASGLQRRRVSLDEQSAEEPIVTAPTAPAMKTDSISVVGTAVGVARSTEQFLEAPVPTPKRVGGIFDRRSRPDMGSIGSRAIEAPPSFHRDVTRLDRRPARAPLVMYAEDDIGLQSMMRLRGIDMEDKKDLVQAFGGKAESLAAVEQGLTWIEKHQHEDGHWSLNQFHHECEGHKCDGHGSVAADAAATGLALLPMLGDGHTHQTGKYKECVEKGILWLVSHQKDDGDLYTENGGNAHMYSHGIAAIALCEAYGMSRDPELREPAQRAIDFIVEAQHDAGGWRYHPKQPGDTSVMGWQIMALKSGQMAELKIPQDTLDKAEQWLRKTAAGTGNMLGRFGYQNAHGQPAMTAEALLCLEYLGADRSDPHLTGGADYMLTQLPKHGQLTSYYWYYGTQAMYHMQGEYWSQWNNALHEMLLETQVKDGPMAGTWTPRDNWERSGGRIYATSLRLLMLEVYYRHLPLYQALQKGL